MTIPISFFFFNFRKKRKLDFINQIVFFLFVFHFTASIPTPIPRIPTPTPSISTPIPRIHTLIHRIPTLIPRISTLIPRVPIIPLIPFPDFPFRLLQIFAYLFTYFI